MCDSGNFWRTCTSSFTNNHGQTVQGWCCTGTGSGWRTDSNSETTYGTCSDGIDNDCDGSTDCSDSDCISFCCDNDPALCETDACEFPSWLLPNSKSAHKYITEPIWLGYCCGDDSGENPDRCDAGAGAVCGGQQEACCSTSQSDWCVYDGVCYGLDTELDTADASSDLEVCWNWLRWTDRDAGPTLCGWQGSGYTWLESGDPGVGDYSSEGSLGCCGDDPGEYAVTTDCSGSTVGGMCCDSSSDVIDSGSCVTQSECCKLQGQSCTSDPQCCGYDGTTSGILCIDGSCDNSNDCTLLGYALCWDVNCVDSANNQGCCSSTCGTDGLSCGEWQPITVY